MPTRRSSPPAIRPGRVWLATALAAAGLAACGTATSGRAVPAVAFPASAAPTPAPTPAGERTDDPGGPGVAPPAPAATAIVAPPAAPPPPPPTAPTAASPATASFMVRALGGAGVGGSVTVTRMGAGVTYEVTVTGLVPGSSHAIHDHLGSCDAANGSRHLAVLTIARASARGVISFLTAVTPFLEGGRRIVIVYATAAPTMIVGCADL